MAHAHTQTHAERSHAYTPMQISLGSVSALGLGQIMNGTDSHWDYQDIHFCFSWLTFLCNSCVFFFFAIPFSVVLSIVLWPPSATLLTLSFFFWVHLIFGVLMLLSLGQGGWVCEVLDVECKCLCACHNSSCLTHGTCKSARTTQLRDPSSFYPANTHKEKGRDRQSERGRERESERESKAEKT